jgi:D-sedoheptulose 7-phosphate isomerase
MNDIKKIIDESSETIQNLDKKIDQIKNAVEEIKNGLQSGKKIVIFGNGGSAADAQHIAAEFLGRFKKSRKSLPAIALSTDTSTITSIANDDSFDFVFSRQCESLVESGDIIIAISTSGNSKNVINGLKVSLNKGAKTIALIGNNGGDVMAKYSELIDIPIIVESSSTPRIQEAHRTIYHIICELVEDAFLDK